MLNIKDLENKIIKYATEYYSGESSISDYQFDTLVEELREQDPENKLLTAPGWGYRPSESTLEKFNHKYGTVGGLKKLSPEGFLKAYRDGYKDVAISPKLDGCSVVIYYENGRLERALTRGDGKEGLDITDKVVALGVPKTTSLSGKFRRRGEFVLPLPIWRDKYNGEKSARNIASGFLNRKSWSIDELKNFDLIFYTTTDSNGKDFSEDKSDFYCHLDGLKTVMRGRVLVTESTMNSEYLDKNLKVYSSQILCDGFVVRLEDEMVAIKWNHEGTQSTVRNIEWRQSRYGKFTPVLKIDPVDIAGATVSNVSGSNYSLLKSKGIGIGSIISVVRSGEIIPYVDHVEKRSDVINAPEVCPECGGELVIDGTDLYCKNPECGNINRKRIHNFINVVCKIDGLGNSIIDKYLDYAAEDNNDLISFVHFFKQNGIQTFDKFKSAPGIGESAVKLLDEVYVSLNNPVSEQDFLLGLGIKGYGETGIKKSLVDNSIDDILEKIENGSHISGVNIQARKSLFENLDFIRKMQGEMTIYRTTTNTSDDVIQICLTGKLSLPRKEFINSFSGLVKETKITSAEYLVTNDPDPNSSKGKAAKKLGVKIVSEDEFRKIIQSRWF